MTSGHFITECIKKDNADVITLNFNPWLCSDSKQVISQFFKQLGNAIKLKKPAMNKICELIDRYADFFDVIQFLPINKTMVPRILEIIKKRHVDI